MKQSYRQIVEFDKEISIYEDCIQGATDSLCGLMYNAWINNPVMNHIEHLMLMNRIRVAWIGEYTEESQLTQHLIPLSIDEIWGYNIKTKSHPVLPSVISNPVYLVNWSKQLFIDMKDFKKKNNVDGDCVNPIAILTAINNNSNLYSDSYKNGGLNAQEIGTWAWDKLSIEFEKPLGFKQYFKSFKDL